MSSAHNHLQTVWTQNRTDTMSGPKRFDTDSFPELIFENVNFEKSQQMTTNP